MLSFNNLNLCCLLTEEWSVKHKPFTNSAHGLSVAFENCYSLAVCCTRMSKVPIVLMYFTNKQGGK